MKDIIKILTVPLLTCAVTYLTIPFVISISRKNHLLDKPDDRKQHKEPIPTMGGIGIFAGLIISAMFWAELIPNIETLCICGSATMLMVTGVYDDMKGLSASTRFFIQFLAGIFAVGAGFVFHLPDGFLGIHAVSPWVEYLLTVFLIAGVTNSYNLIDGIDGLAGGLGLINSAIFGAVFLYLGNLPFAIISFSLGASLLAFLKYNFNPAKIFMGDTGSLVLGFLMVLFGIKLTSHTSGSASSSMLLLLVFAMLLVPVIDTLRVFLFRALKKRSPFSADRSHIHHLLLKTGLDHKKASFILYFANLTLISEAWILKDVRPEYSITALVFSAICFIEILSIKRIVGIKTKINMLSSDYKKMSTDNQLLLKYLNEKNGYEK